MERADVAAQLRGQVGEARPPVELSIRDVQEQFFPALRGNPLPCVGTGGPAHDREGTGQAAEDRQDLGGRRQFLDGGQAAPIRIEADERREQGLVLRIQGGADRDAGSRQATAET